MKMEVDGSITNTPMDIPEILVQILKYVGSNTKDLLPGRLVNRYWNSLTTELLKKKGICVIINHDNIVQYRELLEKSRLELSSINSSADHQGNTCHKLNLIIKMSKTKATTNEEILEINGNRLLTTTTFVVPFPVDELQQLQLQLIRANSICVVESIIDTQNQLDDSDFSQLLQLSSSTLKTLYLVPRDTFKNKMETQTSINEENLQMPISFPKLQCIEYVVEHLSKIKPILPERFIKIVASASDLRILIIRGDYPVNLYDEETMKQRLDQRLFLNKIIAGLVGPPLGHLTHLNIPIYNEQSLTALCQLLLPHLQILTLHQSIVCMMSKLFCGFLANNVPALDKLQLYFLPFCKAPTNVDQFDASFGQIAQITHVGIYTSLLQEYRLHSFYLENLSMGLEIDYYISVITSESVFSSHFPCLTSIGTDTEGLFYILGCASEARQNRLIAGRLLTDFQRIHSTIIFPNVSELSINLDFAHRLDAGVNQSNTIATYTNSMFPALTNLIFTIKEDNEEDEDGFIRPMHLELDAWILRRGLKALLRINGIQSLEINNYFYWLPFLIGNPNDDDDTLSILRENLKHLKFGDVRKRNKVYGNPDEEGNYRSDRKVIMNIDFNYFPHLQKVQIQENVWRTKKNGGLTIFERALEKLNTLRASYQHINFQLY